MRKEPSINTCAHVGWERARPKRMVPGSSGCGNATRDGGCGDVGGGGDDDMRDRGGARSSSRCQNTRRGGGACPSAGSNGQRLGDAGRDIML